MAARIGIGGWTFEPWRGTFYPKGLPHAKELHHASRHLTSIEINGTFYRGQSEATFRKWAEDTPDDFVFSVKGPRFVVQRGQLAESGPSIDRFFESGVTALGRKLGPILWQFAPTKRFDEADFSAFLELLPRKADGLAIRHVVEVRHESFAAPAFIALLRKAGIPVVYAESTEHPAIADLTGDFVYARLQRSREDEASGYSATALDTWAGRVECWADGGAPEGLPSVAPDAHVKEKRDVFLYFIAGAKVRNPAAAQALIARLDGKRSR